MQLLLKSVGVRKGYSCAGRVAVLAGTDNVPPGWPSGSSTRRSFFQVVLRGVYRRRHLETGTNQCGPQGTRSAATALPGRERGAGCAPAITWRMVHTLPLVHLAHRSPSARRHVESPFPSPPSGPCREMSPSCAPRSRFDWVAKCRSEAHCHASWQPAAVSCETQGMVWALRVRSMAVQPHSEGCQNEMHQVKGSG